MAKKAIEVTALKHEAATRKSIPIAVYEIEKGFDDLLVSLLLKEAA